VQLADRTFILSKGSFAVYIIAIRLLLNHSPSEWFSSYKKTSSQYEWLLVFYYSFLVVTHKKLQQLLVISHLAKSSVFFFQPGTFYPILS